MDASFDYVRRIIPAMETSFMVPPSSAAFVALQSALFTPAGIIEVNQTVTVQAAVGFIAELNQVSS